MNEQNVANRPSTAKRHQKLGEIPRPNPLAPLRRHALGAWASVLCLTVAAAPAPAAPPATAPATSTPTETQPANKWVGNELDALVQLYKELHQSPELSFEEEKTAAKMAAQLRDLGFETTEKVGGHGVVGVLKNGAGPTLLLRADMDALPVVEETGLPYASKVRVQDAHGATVGVMHACGHDMHMTMLVGALRYLAAHRDAWQGTLVAIFQPAEERGGGAQAMLADGLYTRFPRPDFALALHVWPDRPAGCIGYRTGYALANVDSVDVVVRGRGGHGAYPHMTIDPIVIAARLVLDLQTIVSREMKPTEPAVVTVGSIHGGTKHNVIGDQCALQLTVRSFTPEVRQQLIDAIRRKANAAAASAGAPEPEIKVSDGTPSLFNDPQLAERVLPAVRQAVGKKNVFESEPSMGAEDFGLLRAPGTPVLLLSVGSVGQPRLDEYKKSGGPPSLHSSKYFPEIEPTLKTGVAALSSSALELLKPQADSAAAPPARPDAAASIATLLEGLAVGTPAEYERIPAIWEHALAAGKRNNAAELRRVLEGSLPQANEPLDDWRAVVLGGGVINGLSQVGVWPQRRVAELVADQPELQARWRRSLELAVAMADNQSIKAGTRYDALRMLGADDFERHGAQLVRYLAAGVNDELQMGAVSALADMEAPAATAALVESLDRLTPHNRDLALAALRRAPQRQEALSKAKRQ